VEQLTEQRGGVTKEKVAAWGRRMMRAEGETGEGSWLPPIAVLLSAGDRGDVVARDKQVEHVQLVKDKKGKKTMKIPESVTEEMDLESGDEVRVEIPQDILRVPDVGGLGPVEVLSKTFLQGLMSDRMDIGEEFNLSIQEIVEDFEQSGREVGLSGSPSRVI